ncbi:MAG TPA: tetratricopeptide repeat protein [Candidatus Acidoferrales bacterium]|nr:tetratricopeptide repeat protein [Candidatus Acidoferrales bacterium]
MTIRRAAPALLLLCGVVCAQDASKDRELDDILMKAAQSEAAGDKSATVNLLETALQKTQKNLALKDREPEVLAKLGKAYVALQRPAEAVRTYQLLLDTLKQDCGPASPRMDRCAEAQYGMGTAEMYKGDFAAAATILRQAIASYSVLVKGSVTDEFRMARLKQQADAQSLLAAALFRTGKKPEAIAAFERALQQLGLVEKNPASGDTLREAARTSARDAQASLDLLRKN